MDIRTRKSGLIRLSCGGGSAVTSEVEAAAPILSAANPSEGLALAYLVELDRAAG
jgi:hypothetical protein